MNKTLILLLGLALASAAAFVTGCESLSKAHDSVSEFSADHPELAAAVKGAAKVVALSVVPNLTDDAIYQGLLNNVVDVAFDSFDTPQDIASQLQSGTATVYPNDLVLQALVAEEFADALKADALDTTAPASGPEQSFKLQLANHLLAPVAQAQAQDAFITLMYAPDRPDSDALAMLDELDAARGL
ncbi:hypothetical protein ACWPKS_15885 [Coraliomargarita sp. W4R72]